MSTIIPNDEDIGAYLDGEMEAGRRQAIEDAMAASPGLAGRVEQLRLDGLALRAACAAMGDLPMPAHLSHVAQYGPAPVRAGHKARHGRRSLLLGGLIAGASLAGLGVLLAPRAKEPSDRLVAEALHWRRGTVTGLRPVAFAGLDPAARDALLSRLLGSHLRLPDLAAEGYALRRLDAGPSTGAPRVQATYEGPSRPSLTIFLAPSRGRDAFALVERPGLRLCVWENDEVASIMAADLPRAALFRLASLAYIAMAA